MVHRMLIILSASFAMGDRARFALFGVRGDSQWACELLSIYYLNMVCFYSSLCKKPVFALLVSIAATEFVITRLLVQVVLR
jgi:hypothetical protein